MYKITSMNEYSLFPIVIAFLVVPSPTMDYLHFFLCRLHLALNIVLPPSLNNLAFSTVFSSCLHSEYFSSSAFNEHSLSTLTASTSVFSTTSESLMHQGHLRTPRFVQPDRQAYTLACITVFKHTHTHTHTHRHHISCVTAVVQGGAGWDREELEEA